MTRTDAESELWFHLRAGRLDSLEIVLQDDSVSRRHAEVRATDKGWRLADLGSMATAGSSADFGKLIADETEKWAKVVRAANIRAE